MAALKPFFDGSQSDARFLVLACIAADEDTWQPIHDKWENVRRERGNPPYIHMADLMPLEGIYKGWTLNQRDYLLDGLFNVFFEFSNHPRFRAFTASVDLDAHRRESSRRDIWPAERICARIVFPTLWDWYGTLPDIVLDVVDVVFDRGEGFMRHIYQDWTSKEIRKASPVWELVRSIGEADMKLTPELQMADMIAWGRNRLLCYRHFEKPWEQDPFYTYARRAADTVRGLWKDVEPILIQGSAFRDEGFDRINPQRRQFLASRSKHGQFERLLDAVGKNPAADLRRIVTPRKPIGEFERFDNAMGQLLSVPHSEIKKKLDAEKAKKQRRKPQKKARNDRRDKDHNTNQ